MRNALVLAAALCLVACATTNNTQQDEPEDKVMQTGSHIPVKDKSAGRPSSTADADTLIRSQKVLGAPPGIPGAAGRSN